MKVRAVDDLKAHYSLSVLLQIAEVHEAGTHSTAELAELFSVARSTVYRTVQRQSVRSEESRN